MGDEDGRAPQTGYFASLTSTSRQREFRPNFGVVVIDWKQGELMVEQRGIEPLASALRKGKTRFLRTTHSASENRHF